MSGPHIDPRRQPELLAELRARADATVPGRSAVERDQDFIGALLQIAARLSSEVTRRLDRVPQKNVHNFFDWIGVRARAARPARLVAVFRRAPAAPPLLVAARARLAASTDDAPAIFETEQDLNILPGNLQKMVAVDADSIYLPPPGLLDPTVIAPPAIARTLKSVAAAGSDTVQVSPAIDLNSGDVVAIGAQQYRIKEIKGDLVTIEPPLLAETGQNAPLVKITSFAPFENLAAAATPAESCGPCATAPAAEPAAAAVAPAAPRNWQEHALYLGDDDVLNIEATAAIQIEDASLLAFDWFYWGKAVKPSADDGTAPDPADDASHWQALPLDKDDTGKSFLAKRFRGAIEPIDVNGRKVRVLRARKAAGKSTIAHNIKIGVARSPLEQKASVAFEAVANTTPVPMLFDFFPLGQEPHLFDSFYIGSAQAFSKRDALVTLKFAVPSATLGPLVVWPRANLPVLLFGVGKDGLLYQLEYQTTHKTIVWSALKRPASTSTAVTLNNTVAPALVEINGLAFVVAASDQEIWCWHAIARAWLSLGAIKDGTTEAIAAIAAVKSGNDIRVTGLKGGKLFQRKAFGATEAERAWTPAYDGANPLFATISAIRKPGTIATVADEADSLVALDRSGKLYDLRNGTTTSVVVSSVLDTNVQPLAVVSNNNTEVMVVVISDDHKKIFAVSYAPPSPLGLLAPSEMPGNLDNRVVEKSLSFSLNPNNPVPSVVFLGQQPSKPHDLGVWLPDGSAGDPVFTSVDSGDRQVANGVGVMEMSQAPDLPGPLIVPGTHADILLAELSLEPLTVPAGNLEQCLFADTVNTAAKVLQVEDAAGDHQFHDVMRVIVIEPGTSRGVYRLATPPAADVKKCRPFALPDLDPLNPGQAVWYDGKRRSASQKKKLVLDVADTGIFTRTQIGIGVKIFEVISVQPTNPPPTEATLDTDLPGNNATVQHYRYLTALSPNDDWVNAEARPLLSLAGAAPPVVALLEASLTLNAPLGFAPRVQRVELDPSQQWAVLATNWTFTPAMGVSLTFHVVPATSTSSTWRNFQVQSNPALSWEYWNGTSWWKLSGLTDSTGHLCNDGDVVFAVPADLQPTGVIGRNNLWIRARLVGGTYGGETYKIHIEGLNTADQTQTIDRSTASVNAPRVISLVVTYVNDKTVFPKYVITRDNLAWRDQSDANRSDNATVELFPTFRDALDELSAKTAKPADEDDGCACDDVPAESLAARCGCEQKQAAKKSARQDGCGDEGDASFDGAAAAADTQTAPGAAAASPMLFIGTDAPLDNGSVRILWIVEDRVDDVRLSVDALHKGKFVPVIVDDETHGLAQTGLMSLTFGQPPTQSDLFGETRFWLRLTPKNANAAWQPVIKSAFLNAVWAEAAETQTSEILGSSDGSPNQVVTLARPPMLDDSVGSGRINSLELRVREPLSEEEAAKLLEADADAVIRQSPGLLSGYWVKWRQVVDPLDEGSGDRVYCADDVSGDVRFGDALHGKIPPRGIDNIVAMTYRRGGGAAGNAIADRSALQVVAPLEGVESVVVGLPAAGGADAASSEATLRDAPAGLWTRGRVLTARDFESTALAYAPEIVQARCLESRSRRGSARLVIVVAGKNPVPTRAMRRELQTFLLRHASPALAPIGCFSVDPPKLMPCYVKPVLIVQSTEETASLQKAVTDRLKALLDPATGGMDIEKTVDAPALDEGTASPVAGPGWPLGAIPTPNDITAALIDIPGIDGVREVTLFADEDYTQPFPASIDADALVILPGGGVRPAFETEAP